VDKDGIAMATHGRTGVTRGFMESVAEHTRRRTSVTMLLRRMTWPKALRLKPRQNFIDACAE
jgi:hypothetical protein